MPQFAARLHIPGQTKLPLNVEVDVADERLILTSGHRNFGDWALSELEVVVSSDGLHITVEDEELVLRTSDEQGLASALSSLSGLSTPRPNSSPARRPFSKDRIGDLVHEDLENRVSEVGQAIESESVPPPEAFGLWLNLLKELNRKHGQGIIPTGLFYELNTQVLDLIPEPKKIPEAVLASERVAAQMAAARAAEPSEL